MTYAQLLAWANDPARNIAELQAACHAYGLSTAGDIHALRGRLIAHITTQPDLAATATHATPFPPAPIAPVPAPAAAPVAPAVYPAWLPIGGALFGIAALVAALAFGIWLLRQPSPSAVVASSSSERSTSTTNVVRTDPQRIQIDVNIKDGISASATSASQPSGSGIVSGPGPGSTTINMLEDGSSHDPRSTVPLPELGFAPYMDTGTCCSATYDLKIPEGYTLILGGVIVNDGKIATDKGNLNAYKGPFEVRARVTNGFYQILRNSAALGDYCDRYRWHIEHGKLMTHVRPLDEWNWASKPCTA